MLPDYNVLRAPGPTPVPPSVVRAMSVPMVAHRTEEFSQVITNVAEGLKPILGTKQDVYILTGSGSLAMEMAIVNFFSEGDPVLVIVSGFFGDRFAKMCQNHRLDVHCIETEWGDVCAADRVESYLKQHPELKAVFVTHCETSTGALNPIQEISEAVHRSSEALMIVDGVSSVGAVEVQMDEWGIDVLVTGSQKGLMLPAGLAFIAVSPRAWESKTQKPGTYMDLQGYHGSLKNGFTPFTPAVSLIFGLKQVLQLINQEGLSEVFGRHRLMRDMTRAACKQWGLDLVATDQTASPSVTAVAPKQVDPDRLRNVVKDQFGIVLGEGSGKLGKTTFRIGHMGYCSPLDVLQYISAIEVALDLLKIDVELGSGTAAAQKVYRSLV